ncbi:hypothetical protein HHSLTHF2_19310 [Vreelandella venusta]|jgi:hypothetical protein|uniref:Uncharacterized protein n=1 Tax=Halomonas hydrothermalis TaxID=115561 RepID=A0A6F8U4H3_9GAMM|nr:hypothetical protein HHSLTHF2_19310 [Halomonas hydrothermalis]
MANDGKPNANTNDIEQEPEYLELPALVTRETGEKRYGTGWLDIMDLIPSSLLSKGSTLIEYLKRNLLRR